MPTESDLARLDNCLRQLFQIIKRPSYWLNTAARAGLDIDRPAASILLLLYHEPETSWRVLDLASRLGVEAPSITRKTQELEAAGLIKRLPSPDDRRSLRLSATPKGQAITKRILKARQDILSSAIKDWPEIDRAQFISYFSRFISSLSNLKKGDN